MGSNEQYGAWIERDVTESDRLNIQHKTLTQALGYILHAKVESIIHPHARIADIATGTGIVLTDLAKVLPSTCQLHGFDISDNQFPEPQTLPSNVTLHTADAKKPFPLDHHGKYDVVHIRYLILAMAHEDWEVVSRNMFQLLKPGGWLQWVEGDLGQAAELLRGDPKIPISDASQLMSEHLAPLTRQYNYCGDHLRDIFRDVGFVNLVREVTSSDRVPESRKAWYLNAKRPKQQFWQRAEEARAARGEATVDVEAKMGQIIAEVSSGALYQRFDIFTFAGQRPE